MTEDRITQNLIVENRNLRLNQRSSMHLPRSLSALETWGFGFTGHLAWIGTAPLIHAALGASAIFVWLPAAIVGMLLNLQVKRLGEHWPEISGGTPNYTTKLLKNYPGLARYAAIAYFIGWAGYLPINPIILTNLIKTNLEPLGIDCPETALKIGFTLIAYIVAFSGTRALAILHTFFILPAVGFLLVFCLQGLGWLAFSPASPGFFPSTWSTLNFVDWAKWSFFAIYIAYACETASAFVADSRRPGETLRFLSLAAWLMPPVILGGSWVLMRLATVPDLGEDTFLNFFTAAKPFWGESASLIVTLLIVSSCLLACATAVSNSPRILYQLALDGHLSPVFAVVSRQGVLQPALIFSLGISLIYLLWGDISRIVVVTGTGYLVAIMSIQLGLWLQRGKPEVRWPWWSLGFFALEAVVLVVGGLSWSWQDVLVGLLSPIAVLACDAAIRRIAFEPFHPAWWIERYRVKSFQAKDFVAFQVIVLILLVCSATAIAWVLRNGIGQISGNASNNLLVILLMTLAFVAIAVACWTSLPQVAAIAEAREHAENLFITALDTVPDTILVLDESGAIRQANPAAVALFEMDAHQLIGRRLNDFLPGLAGSPEIWQSRSEQTFRQDETSLRTIEVTLSHRSNRQLQEYIVILRDITERKLSEETLQQSEETARKQAIALEKTLRDLRQTQAQLIQTEKMSSLGQLVAGVAHEINNPVNFIYGNLTHVGNYTQDLLGLVNFYQQGYSYTDPNIQGLVEEIDLDFLIEDLPKTLSSMKVGANRIREIVLTLRNFSRLDEAEMKPVNIHEGIDSTLVILHNRLKHKPEFPAIQVIKQYGNLPLVECYAGQMNQVFMNILNNSIDALQEQDKARSSEEIKKKPSTLTISTQLLDKNWVRIGIKDNGPGMSASVLGQLFDPFFTTKPVGQGTGLGLSISYQIVVEKHGGKMKCLSRPGEGAEFQIEIPIGQTYKVNPSVDREVLG
ncbi:ATP-binding protein [Trichocoleus sp. DQ-A3]|uniref:ATP-binding protein n=1 Tax=Cyanophyceae TaxID=3028117 RepID=UPI001688E692|nr:ATP-binding protein [Coleofasciculus sp. FACHB-125]MBD1902369.1 amino acid permease [Coleofasciculus sp. FACHB-125]